MTCMPIYLAALPHPLIIGYGPREPRKIGYACTFGAKK